MRMTGRCLLDTSIVIALFKGDPLVKKRLAEKAEVFVSSIVLGELYFGARKSMKTDEGIALIAEFAAAMPVLGCDERTAREYGIIKNDLRVKGRPIPENDIWNAAIARQYELALISRDEHYDSVSGLKVEKW